MSLVIFVILYIKLIEFQNIANTFIQLRRVSVMALWYFVEVKMEHLKVCFIFIAQRIFLKLYDAS